ncbi:MAG: hypothetical protein IT353_11755 [Gemmatimonadaceae bacterium]|nr:hypothetical protein [Gemmatimonadaceae bacterium]
MPVTSPSLASSVRAGVRVGCVLGVLVFSPVARAQSGASVDSTQPLGSFTNPVLTRGPSGQAEYIARMRCPDGAAVKVLMRGSRGDGPHGHIIDGYSLRCEALGTTHQVHMDMYHGEGDRERRPVAPFTVLAEHPARLAVGCPPRVVADADSSARYVFIWWEVEKPARLTNPPKSITWPTFGMVTFEFVVDSTGAIEPGSVKPGPVQNAEMHRVATEQLSTLRFEPAEHRAGCRVRQFSGVRFTFSTQ